MPLATLSFVTRVVDARPERLLDLHAQLSERYPALLESIVRGGTIARFDLPFAFPEQVLTKRSDGEDRLRTSGAATFLDTFDRHFREERTVPVPCPLPFNGGWLLFVGYEIGGESDRPGRWNHASRDQDRRSICARP